MPDLPPPAAETILVEGRAITPAAGAEAFGALRLAAEALQPASGRVEDSLRGIGGVQLFRASSTRTANPTAEGLTARGLAGNAASRIEVTLDGAPLADPFFGFVSWGSLFGQPIATAELIRGGGLGGPGALAGTLALMSAAPQTAGRARAGSRGSTDLSGQLALPVNDGFFGVQGGWARGDGHLLVAEPGPADVSARYDQWAVSAAARGGTGDVTLGGRVAAFADRRLRGIEGADIESSGGDASLSLAVDGGWRVTALAHAQLRDFKTVTRTLDPTRTVATTVLDQLKTPATGWGLGLTAEPPLGEDVALRLGAAWRAADGRTIERFRYVAGAPTRLRTAGGDQWTAGLFADGSWRASPVVLLTAAGRIDSWRLGAGTLRETDLATGGVTLEAPSAARSGTEASGRLGAVWRPVPAVRLRAAGYRGWRLPTLNELHRPFRAGADATAANPALEPERLWGAEASLGWQPLPAIDIGGTLFWNRLDGAIANVTLGEGPGLFPGVGFVGAGGRYRQRQNLGSIESRGLEADARLRLGEVSLGGSLALVSARVTGGGLDGRRPAQAPEASGSVTAAWDGPSAGLSAALRYLGPRYEDDLNERRLAGAATLDVEARLRLAPRLWLEAAAENLADATIETGFSGAQFERGQPRTLWIGIRAGGS